MCENSATVLSEVQHAEYIRCDNDGKKSWTVLTTSSAQSEILSTESK